MERENTKSWLELQTEAVEVASLRDEIARQRVHSSDRSKLLSRIPRNDEGGDGDQQVAIIGGKKKLLTKVQGEWLAADLLSLTEQTSDVEGDTPQSYSIIVTGGDELDESCYKTELGYTITDMLEDDDDLVLSLDINSVYEIEVFLMFGGSPTEGFSFAFEIPDGAELRWTNDLDGNPGIVYDESRYHVTT